MIKKLSKLNQKHTKVLLFIALLMIITPLISATRYEWYNTNDDSVTGTGLGAIWKAQTFTVGTVGTNEAFDINNISIKLYRIGSPGTCWISIRAVNATGKPTGSDLTTANYSCNTLTTDINGQWINVTVNQSYTLQASTTYALVIRTSAGDASNYIGWRADDTSATYTGGTRYRTENSGTTWVEENVGIANDIMFEIHGITASGSVTVDLIYPEDGVGFSSTALNFTGNYTTNNYNMTNATYYVWYSNGTLFNSTIINVTGNYTNTTTLNIDGFTLNNYKWGIKLCTKNLTDYYCQFSSNRTFTIGASLNYSSYIGRVFETSYQKFSAAFNILEGSEISSVKLIYNGTNYTISDITNNGNIINFSKWLDIPLNYANKNTTNDFYFTFTYAGSSTQRSETLYQNVSLINLKECDIAYTQTALNFTIRDEKLSTNINPVNNPITFKSTFNYWLGTGSIYKNYSFQLLNSTNQNNITFCIDPYHPNNYTFKTNLDSIFSAVYYSENEYYLRNATLTNKTADYELFLYLLDSTTSTKFYITIKQGVIFIDGALTNIAKYFIGEGVYKTVSIKLSDSDGKFPFYADLDSQYIFSVVKDGKILGIIKKTLTCSTAPCTAEINLQEDIGSVFSGYGNYYASNIYSNLTYNKTSKMIEYTFFDITGLANYFRLEVQAMSFNGSIGNTICNVYSYSSAGVLTCNMSGYNGDFTAYTYISRSPELLDKILPFLISETAETLGLLGIFLNLAIIITMVMSALIISKGNPSAVVFILGITILLLKIGGIFPLSWKLVVPIECIIVWLLMKVKV